VPWTQIEFAHSAGKHGISRERSRYVVEHAVYVFTVAAAVDPQSEADRLLFVGDDQQGVPLEIMGIELDDGSLLIIHAMKMRRAYRQLYQEVMREQLR
jgi:hypothetical protein